MSLAINMQAKPHRHIKKMKSTKEAISWNFFSHRIKINLSQRQILFWREWGSNPAEFYKSP